MGKINRQLILGASATPQVLAPYKTVWWNYLLFASWVQSGHVLSPLFLRTKKLNKIKFIFTYCMFISHWSTVTLIHRFWLSLYLIIEIFGSHLRKSIDFTLTVSNIFPTASIHTKFPHTKSINHIFHQNIQYFPVLGALN